MEELIHSGIARYEYRHFIIFGSASQFAAMATECAGDQGAWWEFHDAYLLDAQARNFTRAGAIDLARDNGLDIARFTQCVDNEEHRERILEMQRHARSVGISGTPTFRINGQPAARSLSGIIEQVRAAAEAIENQEGS